MSFASSQLQADPASLSRLEALDSEVVDRAWKQLETNAVSPTQSHAFASALSRTIAKQAKANVVLVDGIEGGQAVLPLCRDNRRFARWRTLGSREVFEPIDALSADIGGIERLAAFLASQGRPLVFDRLPANSPLVSALKLASKGRGWFSLRPAVGTPTLSLDRSWDNPEQRFNAGRRSDFRRAERKAARLGDVSFEVLTPNSSDFHRLFDEAVMVEARSWKFAAGSALLSDYEKQAFFREFFGEMCRQQCFVIAFMRINKRAVAVQMAVEWQQRYWLYKIGYDEEFKSCSPGTLLMLHTLGWAAKRGLQSFELLGEVESWITDLWTREVHDCVRIQTYPISLFGAIALAVDGLAWLAQRLPFVA